MKPFTIEVTIEGVDLKLTGQYHPARAARVSGAPENSTPAEGMDIEVENMWVKAKDDNWLELGGESGQDIVDQHFEEVSQAIKCIEQGHKEDAQEGKAEADRERRVGL